MPVADEVGRLQTGTDAECRYFQTFAEQGHYAGRTTPSTTRQGIYAVAPSGQLLASLNNRDVRRVAAMLQQAKERYAALPVEQRRGDVSALADAASARFERHYPTDGLVLHVFSRDLPRERAGRGWRATAWNQDFAWFRKAEAQSLVPPAEVGNSTPWPKPLLLRLARCNLIDNVRGQTQPHRPQDVQVADLRTEVTAVEGDLVTLRFAGTVGIARTGQWATRGYGQAVSEQQLGFDAKLLGDARYDRKAERFVAFRLLAVGPRWGATEFNAREDDPGPAGMAVAFTLAEPNERTAPSLHWVYGWR